MANKIIIIPKSWQLSLINRKNDFLILKSLIWYLSIIIICPYVPWAVFTIVNVLCSKAKVNNTRKGIDLRGVIWPRVRRRMRRLYHIVYKLYRDIIIVDVEDTQVWRKEVSLICKRHQKVFHLVSRQSNCFSAQRV